jgi:hypothetical protein
MNNYPDYAYLAAAIEDQFDPPGIQAPLQQSLLEYDDTSMGCGSVGAS